MKKLLAIALFTLAVSCKKDDSNSAEVVIPQYAPDNTMIIEGTTYNLNGVRAYLALSGGYYVSATPQLLVKDSNTYPGSLNLSFPLRNTIPDARDYDLSDSLINLYVSWPEERNGVILSNYSNQVTSGTLRVVTENGVKKFHGLNLPIKRIVSVNPITYEQVHFSFTVVTQ